MNNKELANFLEITEQGLYKWRKSRPNLYKIVMEWKDGLNYSSVNNEILNLFNQLTEDEQRMYKSEMENRILKRKLEEK